MNIIHEIPISAHKAVNMMHLFNKDTFLEENDPDLAKDVTTICNGIEAASFDIKYPEETIPQAQDDNQIQNDDDSKIKTTESPIEMEPEPKHHKKHHHKKTEDQ